MDYISLHNYYGNAENDTEDFFAKTQDLERFIHTVISTCDYVKAKKRSKKTLNLSFDEWNVWFHAMQSDSEEMQKRPWQIAPHLLEDIYDFEDAILVGLILITFLQHADRLKMACLAQLVNVIAPIMTENDGGAWKQTIYYPFLHASKFGRGTALRSVTNSTMHDSKKHANVTDVESVAVYNEEKEEVTIFAVNRSVKEDAHFEADVRCFEGYRVIEYLALEHDDMKVTNSITGEKVTPRSKSEYELKDGIFTTNMKKCSWNVIRLGKTK